VNSLGIVVWIQWFISSLESPISIDGPLCLRFANYYYYFFLYLWFEYSNFVHTEHYFFVRNYKKWVGLSKRICVWIIYRYHFFFFGFLLLLKTVMFSKHWWFFYNLLMFNFGWQKLTRDTFYSQISKLHNLMG